MMPSIMTSTRPIIKIYKKDCDGKYKLIALVSKYTAVYKTGSQAEDNKYD